MNELLNFSQAQVYTALLLVCRISGLLIALPVFGDSPTPVRIRIFLAITLSIVMWPILPPHWGPEESGTLVGLAAMAFGEVLVGLIIGFFSKLVFAGLVMAASLVGYQMGFGTSSLIVPDAGGQMDAFSAFHRIVIMLIFLSLNLHHIFFSALAFSFKAIPAGGISISSNIGEQLIISSAAIFSIAVQLAAPIIIALLFTMAALGLVARVVPQMNVFTMSFPFSFCIGLLIYIASMPFYPNAIVKYFDHVGADLKTVVMGLKG